MRGGVIAQPEPVTLPLAFPALVDHAEQEKLIPRSPEEDTMRKNQVEVGATYSAKVSGKVVPVRLDSPSIYGGWNATNTITGRTVRIKSAAKLRSKVTS